jgi:hypothetical protein
MSASREISRAVEARACGRCEYCRMHKSLQGATFHKASLSAQDVGSIAV